MATHSSIFAWRIPQTEKPGSRLQSMGLQRIRHNWVTSTHTNTHTHTHTQSWNKLKHNIPTFGAAAKVMLRGKHIGLYILSMVKIYNDLNLRTYKLKILT